MKTRIGLLYPVKDPTSPANWSEPHEGYPTASHPWA